MFIIEMEYYISQNRNICESNVGYEHGDFLPRVVARASRAPMIKVHTLSIRNQCHIEWQSKKKREPSCCVFKTKHAICQARIRLPWIRVNTGEKHHVAS